MYSGKSDGVWGQYNFCILSREKKSIALSLAPLLLGPIIAS